MATLIDSYSETNQDWQIQLYTTSAGRYVAQSFTNTNSITLDSCKFYLKKVGSPTGNITAKLYAHSGTYGTSSIPTGSPLATSDNFAVSTLPTSYQLITFNFSGANRIVLDASTYYEIEIDYSQGNNTNKIYVGMDVSTSSHTGNYASSSGIYWSSGAGEDLIFYVYGETGTGTAWVKNVYDTVTVTDTIAKTVTVTKSDLVTVIDDIDTIFTDTLSKTLTDSVTVTDAIGKSFTKILSDTVTVTDTIVNSVILKKSDTVTITDAIVKSISLSKSDTVTVMDNATTSKSGALFLSLSDIVTVTDSLTTTTAYVRSFDDTVTVTDVITTNRNLFTSNYMVYEDGKLKIIVNGAVVQIYG